MPGVLQKERGHNFQDLSSRYGTMFLSFEALLTVFAFVEFALKPIA